MKKFLKNLFKIAIIAFLVSKVISLIKLIKDIQGKYSKKYIFKGEKINYNEQQFSHESIAVILSGVEIDFRGATLGNNATLDIYGSLSGISITVPEEWNVELYGDQKMSGISNRTRTNEDEDTPILTINYKLNKSGLDIKN